MLASVIGLLAAGALPFAAGPVPAAACDYESTGSPGDASGDEVRVEARWSAGGRIEVGISQYLMVNSADCEWAWSERWLPARRFVPADPPLGRWLNSSPIAAFGSALRVSARRGADGSTEFALQQEAFGKWQARRSVGAFLPDGGSGGAWLRSPTLEFWFVSAPSYSSSQPSFQLERDKAYFATLVLEDGGEVEIELLHDAAPLTVNWFIRLARDGYYDGRRFELVTKGDAEEARADYAAYAGSPLNYRAPQIPLEYTGLPNLAGAVGLMPPDETRAGTPEFYIKTEDYEREEDDAAWFADPPFVFEQVVSGLGHVRAIPAVDRRRRQIGPRIEEVRIRERQRSVDWPAGVIAHGFRAGTAFDGNVLGDPDAPVLVRKYVDLFYCFWCRMIEPPVAQYLFEELVVAGDVRYEVIPVSGRDESVELVRALACATDQGKFWEFHDLLEAVHRGGYSPYVLARAAWMDVSEFRACIAGGGYAGRIADWQEQSMSVCGDQLLECGWSRPAWEVGGSGSGGFEIVKRARIIRDRLALPDGWLVREGVAQRRRV